MTTPFAHYPRWAQTLAHGIRARLGNAFLLHGNTLDLLPAPKAADEPRTMTDFLPLTRFLGEWVFGQRDVIIEYQRANGAIFHTRDSHKHFIEVVENIDAVHGTSFSQSLPREPVAFCALLDSFLKQVVHRNSGMGVAVMFPYAETLIPESAGESNADDRVMRVYIQKWSTDPALLSANVTIVLTTENLADVSSRLVRSPQTIEIEVARPDEAERLAFLQAIRDPEWYANKSDLAGTITLCPPSALKEPWSRRFPDPLSSLASGWMRVRARARQHLVELPLVISDHADWDGLTATITATGASEIWVTHGQEDALVHWSLTHGLHARPLAIVGYGDEDETDGVAESVSAAAPS